MITLVGQIARRGALAAIALFAVASSGAAQVVEPRVFELGVDGGLRLGLGDAGTTEIDIPGGQFRIGFLLSRTFSVEPAFSFRYFKTEGIDGSSRFTLTTGLLYHFQPNREDTQLYLRPFVRADFPRGGEFDPGVGVGLGVKIPWDDRLAFRFEGNVEQQFDPSASAIGLLAGLSFYTR